MKIAHSNLSTYPLTTQSRHVWAKIAAIAICALLIGAAILFCLAKTSKNPAKTSSPHTSSTHARSQPDNPSPPVNAPSVTSKTNPLATKLLAQTSVHHPDVVDKKEPIDMDKSYRQENFNDIITKKYQLFKDRKKTNDLLLLQAELTLLRIENDYLTEKIDISTLNQKLGDLEEEVKQQMQQRAQEQQIKEQQLFKSEQHSDTDHQQPKCNLQKQKEELQKQQVLLQKQLETVEASDQQYEEAFQKAIKAERARYALKRKELRRENAHALNQIYLDINARCQTQAYKTFICALEAYPDLFELFKSIQQSTTVRSIPNNKAQVLNQLLILCTTYCNQTDFSFDTLKEDLKRLAAQNS